MKSLSIANPFGILIADGIKRVENRTRYTNYRGPLAIHASKATRYGGYSVFDLAARYGVMRNDLAFGAIIAVAQLVDCVRLTPDLSVPAPMRRKYPWLEDHEHTEGPFCLILEEVRRLENPIPWTGRQWLFDVPDDFEEIGLEATRDSVFALF